MENHDADTTVSAVMASRLANISAISKLGHVKYCTQFTNWELLIIKRPGQLILAGNRWCIYGLFADDEEWLFDIVPLQDSCRCGK